MTFDTNKQQTTNKSNLARPAGSGESAVRSRRRTAKYLQSYSGNGTRNRVG